MNKGLLHLLVLMVAAAFVAKAASHKLLPPGQEPVATAVSSTPKAPLLASPSPEVPSPRRWSTSEPLSLFGLSPGANQNEVKAYRDSLGKKGYRVEAIFDRELRGEVDGLDAQRLGKAGFQVFDPKDNAWLLTAFLEDNGSVGLITCESAGYPLMQGNEALLRPGDKLKDVRAVLGKDVKRDSGWILVCQTPKGWISLKFLKNFLYGFTLTGPSRGPVKES